jgi:pimeloyl-ACP methyl ester carboxylesterase
MVETINTKIKNRHGLNISVLIEKPEQPKGMVFILHGFSSAKSRGHVSAIAQSALENGLTAIRFDATHSSGESDGKIELATVTSFAADLEDVITWTKKQEWYQEPFTLVGMSLGGLAVLEHTHTHPSEVKAIAPIGTVVSGDLSFESYHTYKKEELEEWQKKGYIEMHNPSIPDEQIKLPWSHMEDRMRYDALSYAHKITVPSFMIVGSEDTSCPPEHQQMLHDALGSKQKELHIIKDMTHYWRAEEHVALLKNYFDVWLKKII